MYQSPIELIQQDVKYQLENEIMKAVQKVGINIDKAELLRALEYDRNQYDVGYNEAMRKIVHCGDCQHYQREFKYCRHLDAYQDKTWFCADGAKFDDDSAAQLCESHE